MSGQTGTPRFFCPMGGLNAARHVATNAHSPICACAPHRHRSRQWYCHGGHGVRAWWGRAGESSRCEDPAPTVGRLRGWHCDPNAAIAAAMRISSTPHVPMSPWFYNDAARRVVFCPSRLPPMGIYALYHDAACPKHRGRGGRGNLRVAKTPPLQSAFAGISLRGIAALTTIYAPRTSMGRREGGSRRGTPRRYGLREPELQD